MSTNDNKILLEIKNIKILSLRHYLRIQTFVFGIKKPTSLMWVRNTHIWYPSFEEAGNNVSWLCTTLSFRKRCVISS